MAQGTRGVKKDYAKMSKGKYSDEDEVEEFGGNPGGVHSPVRSSKVEVGKQSITISDADNLIAGMVEKDDEERELLEQLQKLERKKKESGDKKQEELREKRKEALREKIQKAKEELESIESGSVIEIADTAKIGNGKKGKTERKKKTEIDTGINISDLRNMQLLDEVVERKMADLGLNGSSEESTDSDQGSEKGKRGYTRRKATSGIKAKPSDRVICPQVWPQSRLQLEYASKNIRFKDLSFQQFVAGETEIIMSCKSAVERDARLSLLNKISYYYDVYDWRALLDFYAAFLRRIEMGQKSWGDSPSDLEVPLLSGHVRVKSKQFSASSVSNSRSRNITSRVESQKSGDSVEVFFCSPYQRNRCQQKYSHTATLAGKLRYCQHICATCWFKDGNKLVHPECSSACPNKVDN